MVSSRALALFAAGCSSSQGSAANGAGGNAAATATSTASTGSGSGTTASSGGGEPFDAGAPMTTYEASIGPIDVAAGEEKTVCIHVRMTNEAPIFVRRFRADLGPGAHHFIAYRSPVTDEQLDPQPCHGFSGVNNGEHALFIAQQGKSELVFPNDEGGAPVGLPIAAKQMMRLELHVLNTSADAIQVTGTASVDAIMPASDQIASDVAFWGTSHLNAGGTPPSDAIPAHGSGDTGVMFQAALPSTKIFALTTHQHALGQFMKVWRAKDEHDTSSMLIDSESYADPALQLFDPALAVGDAAAAGLTYECRWNNPGDHDVPYGESFDKAEMCFLWHYYYPAKGMHYCIDQACKIVGD